MTSLVHRQNARKLRIEHTTQQTTNKHKNKQNPQKIEDGLKKISLITGTSVVDKHNAPNYQNEEGSKETKNKEIKEKEPER